MTHFLPLLPAPYRNFHDMILLVGIEFSGLLMGLIPAIKAYRQSLEDGMTVRL